MKKHVEKFMIEGSNKSAPKWFTVVPVVLLVWNLLGVMAYVAGYDEPRSA